MLVPSPTAPVVVHLHSAVMHPCSRGTPCVHSCIRAHVSKTYRQLSRCFLGWKIRFSGSPPPPPEPLQRAAPSGSLHKAGRQHRNRRARRDAAIATLYDRRRRDGCECGAVRGECGADSRAASVERFAANVTRLSGECDVHIVNVM